MKRIVFLTGTRADFGKLKSLIRITQADPDFEVHIFATGMHLQWKYGYTVHEIEKAGFKNIFKYMNSSHEEAMDINLAQTVEGLSRFVRQFQPDMLVIHGDRVEALAGAIVGAINNIHVAHIEGGELSGTIDELIRHSVSKLSHLHYVANEEARQRLIQMGEQPESIFVIGSPDVDVMLSDQLPSFQEVQERYDIPFGEKEFGVLMFHPVTTEVERIYDYAQDLVSAILDDALPYIVIYPNNDLGSNDILRAYDRFKKHPRFKLYPSLRFEYFLVLLKNARLIVGNSSAGIREAPYYGTPTVNVGTRQQNRSLNPHLIHCGYEREAIAQALQKAQRTEIPVQTAYGTGNSDRLFFETLSQESTWAVHKQKIFRDLPSFQLPKESKD